MKAVRQLARDIAMQEARGWSCAGQRELLRIWLARLKDAGVIVAGCMLMMCGPILSALGLLRG